MRFLPSLIRLAGEGEWTGSGLARQCVVARSCAVEVVLGLPDRMVDYLVRGSIIFFACEFRLWTSLGSGLLGEGLFDEYSFDKEEDGSA